MPSLFIALCFAFVVGVIAAIWVIFLELAELRRTMLERQERHLELMRLVLDYAHATAQAQVDALDALAGEDE